MWYVNSKTYNFAALKKEKKNPMSTENKTDNK